MPTVPPAGAGPTSPTRIVLLDELTPPIERATVADPFRVVPSGVAPRTETADYVVVDSFEQADVAALPVHWDVYGTTHRHEARASIEQARSHGLKTVIWVNGDHEADIGAPDTLQFQLAAARQRPGRMAAMACYPVFIDDPGDGPVDRAVGSRPRVGFCGQGDERTLAAAASTARKLNDRLQHRLGRREHLPEPLASHVRLRRRVLAELSRSPLVDDDFIVHDRYRAGLVDQQARRDPNEPTNQAFRANITATDYTVCVRGGGNFSTRLYETMALGRIPILIDTGGLLPWDRQLPWEDLTVRVPAAQIGDLAAIVADRHRTLGPDGVRDLQQRCRETWVRWLTLEGFFSRFGALVRTSR